MNPSQSLSFISQALEVIQAHFWLNASVKLSFLILIIYFLYRFFMSARGATFRAKIPLLNIWYGHREIRSLLRVGEYAQAGDRLIALGNIDQALDVFIRGNLFGRAADIQLRRKNVEKAAVLYERGGEFVKAAEIYFERKQFDLAEGALQKAGKKELTGDYYIKSGNLERAACAFFSAARFSDAAETFEKLGKRNEAADAADRAFLAAKKMQDGLEGEPFRPETEAAGERAARLLKWAGDFESAAEVFQELKNIGQAAECYLLAGQPKKAAEFFQKAGDLQKASQAIALTGDQKAAALLEGERFLLEGKYREAVEQFKRGEDFHRAAEIHRDLEEFDQAAHMYEEAKEYSLAGFLYKKANRMAEAAEAFKRAGDLEEAERCFQNEERTELEIVPEGIATAPTPKRYIRMEEIGRGGMGIVYRAKDTKLDRIVALKILHGAFKKNLQAVETFLREAKAAASLNHPNIVTVFDTGLELNDYYIAMEYIQGKTLKEILRSRGKFSNVDTREILRQLLSALAYAHANKIVHRDLTTNNIMWTRDKRVKIMDFGLAKIIKELLSEQSIIGGTPSYMSPEQTLGKPIDYRTDIYSVGICMYELTTGSLPFKGGDLGYHHVHTSPPDPKESEPQISEDMRRAILRALQKEPQARYQSIAELQMELGLK